jgi:hypothetical protein
MKKLTTLTLIGAASALALSATAVSAQDYGRYDHNRNNNSSSRDGYPRGWIGVDARQAQLDRRIDQGVRNGAISRSEARRLRDDFHRIALIEARYKRDGLNNWERADLDRRLDALSRQIRIDRSDRVSGYGYGRDSRR